MCGRRFGQWRQGSCSMLAEDSDSGAAALHSSRLDIQPMAVKWLNIDRPFIYIYI